eukprot:sb/3466251/
MFRETWVVVLKKETLTLVDRMTSKLEVYQLGQLTYAPLSQVKNRDGFIVVGGTDRNDNKASASNYGGCIDIFAPGEDVTIARGSGSEKTDDASSTIYAAAAVAGVAIQNAIDITEMTEAPMLKTLILGHATKDKLDLGPAARNKGTPNRLLFDICPYYKLSTPGKCSYAVSDDLDGKLKKVQKSIVTFDGTNQHFDDDCLTVVVFDSEISTTKVEAVHSRSEDGKSIEASYFIISAGENVITLRPGPVVSLNGQEMKGSTFNDTDNADPDSRFDVVVSKVSVEYLDNDLPHWQAVVRVTLPRNLTVMFDGSQQILIHVNSDYIAHTTGLCGFYDNRYCSFIKHFNTPL